MASQDKNSPTPTPVADEVRAALGGAPAKHQPPGQRRLIVMLAFAALLCGVLLVSMQLQKPLPPVTVAPPAAPATTSVGSDVVGPSALEAPAPAQALSIKLAQAAWQAGDYERALLLYETLLVRAQQLHTDKLLEDYLVYRTALCNLRLQNFERAMVLLAQASASDSPVVRMGAATALAITEVRRGLHFRARTHSYEAIGAMCALQASAPTSPDLDYLIARATTERAIGSTLGLRWAENSWNDPFDGLDVTEVTAALRRGAQVPQEAMLGPYVHRTSESTNSVFIAVYKAPLAEVLARLAGATGVDVRFKDVAAGAQGRAVTFIAPDLPVHRAYEYLAGMSGLVAQITGEGAVIVDPVSGSSLGDQTRVLRDEACALWRRFAVRYPSDPRLPQGQMALAIMIEEAQDAAAALAHYQSISKRYSKDEVAPAAMLHEARLRMKLRDFPGARATLLNLLDTYPAYPVSDQLYLSLAQSTMEMGLYEEALALYRRAYLQELSRDAQRLASLGAAKCSFALTDYGGSSEWLTRCIKHTLDPHDPTLLEAYLLLGRSNALRGRHDQASDAYRQALALEPGGDSLTQALIGLAQAQSHRRAFATVLELLEKASAQKLTAAQQAQVLALKGKMLRELGLPDRAIQALRAPVALLGEDVRTEPALELARAYVQAEEPQRAHDVLMTMLPRLAAGQAHGAKLQLAALCLELGKQSQTVAMCTELLADRPADDIRQQAQELLAKTYAAMGMYDKAALALQAPPKKESP